MKEWLITYFTTTPWMDYLAPSLLLYVTIGTLLFATRVKHYGNFIRRFIFGFFAIVLLSFLFACLDKHGCIAGATGILIAVVVVSSITLQSEKEFTFKILYSILKILYPDFFKEIKEQLKQDVLKEASQLVKEVKKTKKKSFLNRLFRK